jgi:WD40 repeat protein
MNTIKVIKKITHSFSLDKSISFQLFSAIIELSDKRLAYSKCDCEITIISIDYANKKAEISFTKPDAHDDEIEVLSAFPNSHLASASRRGDIKIWKVLDNSLEQIGYILGNSVSIRGIFSLSKNKFLSTDYDNITHIWQASPPFEELTEFKKDYMIFPFFETKEDLLVCGFTEETSVEYLNLVFWNLDTNQFESILNDFIYVSASPVKINQQYIAVYRKWKIAIVDYLNYTILKEIDFNTILTQKISGDDFCMFELFFLEDNSFLFKAHKYLYQFHWDENELKVVFETTIDHETSQTIKINDGKNLLGIEEDGKPILVYDIDI